MITRLLLLLSGDIEENPGPEFGEPGMCIIGYCLYVKRVLL